MGIEPLAMNAASANPLVIGQQRAISYEITRWDVFKNWMTVVFRNRILQVFILAVLLLNGWLIVGHKSGTQSLPGLVFDTLFYVVEFVGFIAFFQAVVSLANAFIPKHRGLVGRHVLEITEQGLVERTDFNETLHRWPSVCRILHLWGYLYIYVSDTNSHQIPKRCFSAAELGSFEAELRQRMGGRGPDA